MSTSDTALQSILCIQNRRGKVYTNCQDMFRQLLDAKCTSFNLQCILNHIITVLYSIIMYYHIYHSARILINQSIHQLIKFMPSLVTLPAARPFKGSSAAMAHRQRIQLMHQVPSRGGGQGVKQQVLKGNPSGLTVVSLVVSSGC